MSKLSKWLKKDDRVIVIAGNDKGKTGLILSKMGTKVLVQGINVRKKHLKKREQNAKSEIIQIETPIDVSNLMACTSDGQPVKLRVKVGAEGSKELFYHLDGKDVIYRTIKISKN